FSAFAVLRDVMFLIGISLAGLADAIDVRVLVVVASLVLIGSGFATAFLPGIGRPAAEWRRAMSALRGAAARPTVPIAGRQPTTVMEVPAATLRGLMAVPELSALFLSKLTERLNRTNNADLPRFSGVDQASLRDLRTPRSGTEAGPAAS